MASVTDKANKLLRTLPRISLGNLKDIAPKKKKRRAFEKGKTHGRGHKGQGQRGTLPRLGFEGGNTPFYLRIPKEPYYQDHHLRRQYPPLSLLQLQRMIDLGRVDASRPIDLTQLCNTGLYRVEVDKRHFGANLTDEGADLFAAKVHIEVQWASELVIAAVERSGGTITCRYFDAISLRAVVNPERFFKTGVPIPLCKFPPQDAIEFYSSAESRGYLADPKDIELARLKLAQKYGYTLPDLSVDPLGPMLRMPTQGDPRTRRHGEVGSHEGGWSLTKAHAATS
ncbi:hypothetical protein C0Q70_16560 [Pomacea canaliculata]|uniref:Large ribosomal subunit protein uL15m n=1 Tax=Pomacea canaliculata TaxID=400727 RepID=A0A2T7NQ45_POMCA|nr:hypothetical protein C0Q70_16560 [Pomacea canaliculata]